MNDAVNIKIRGKRYAVPKGDILYLEKDGRRIHAHTKKGKLTFYGRFCELSPVLDERFVFCHKSYVLNMDEIRCLSQERVIISDGTELRFGKRCYGRLRRAFEEYKKA